MKLSNVSSIIWNLFIYVTLSIFFVGSGSSQSPLHIPDTLSGNEIFLKIQHAEHEILPGFKSQTIAYNGNYLGPTIILKKEQLVKMHVENLLGEPTTTHWHGLHVSPENDGSPHVVIQPSMDWITEFKVMDQAATYWYHPHLHGKTFEHVMKGAAGLILIRDDDENKLKLPRSYGVDDFPIVFQFQTMDQNSKQIKIENDFDNITLVNGTYLPELNCPAQMVRFRLLNASSRRILNLGFDNRKSFYQIATDAGLLDQPVLLDRITLGGGERAEILVDFSADLGKTLAWVQYGNELPLGYPGGPVMGGMLPLGPLDNRSFKIMDLNVGSPTANPVYTKPDLLVKNDPINASGVMERTLRFTAQPMMSPTNFFINGEKYDENKINFSVSLNDKEIWNITNQTMMAHPFHIHGNPFYVLSVNGNNPAENMLGRKDVVIIPPFNGNVRIITQYLDFHHPVLPFMYHCHILSHEDDGMMGQFLVKSGINLAKDFNSVELWKLQFDFTKRWLQIESTNQESGFTVNLYNLNGVNYIQKSIQSSSVMLDLFSIPSDVYFLNLIADKNFATFKIVKI